MADADCGQKNISTTIQDALYVNGKPVKCHRLEDGNLYICRNELAYFCELIHVKEMTGDLCLEAYLQQTGTWHLFSQWKEYAQGYITGIISVYNTEMRYSGVRVIRRDENITIDVFMNFIDNHTNYRDPLDQVGKISVERAPELIKEGIELWGTGTYYYNNEFDSFGVDSMVVVTVNVHEKNSGESFDDEQQFVDIHFMRAGHPYQTESKVCIFGGHLIPGGEWKINNVGHIHAYPLFFGQDEDGNDVRYEYNESSFPKLIAHEIGHVFGLGDGYSKGKRNTGEHGDDVPKWDMMRYNGMVSSNDIEMLLLAWKENDAQYFVNERGHEKSKAIRGAYYDKNNKVIE